MLSRPLDIVSDALIECHLKGSCKKQLRELLHPRGGTDETALVERMRRQGRESLLGMMTRRNARAGEPWQLSCRL